MFLAFCVSLAVFVDILQYSMPLAFLPSVLEDSGHEPMEIAAAIGVYYWTGFAGCAIITAYQIARMLLENEDTRSDEEQVRSVASIRKQMTYLIVGLGVGSVTLIGQALYPACWVHTACRFVQGTAGSVIFFYAFLLAASLFEGRQQVFAMTVTSTALNVAEVLGSSLGAYLFDSFGQRAVFWTLGAVSLLNQVLLLVAMRLLRSTNQMAVISEVLAWDPSSPFSEKVSWKGARRLRRALCRAGSVGAIVLISTAGTVKASMEEVLPFHADHRWGLNPLEIGNLFSIVAFAYIGSSLLAGEVWLYLDGNETLFSAAWLVTLGLAAWSVILTAAVYKHQAVLVTNLLIYGVALGFTQTPSALLLAEVVDRESGRAKDVVNGVWNTMWEAGGSLGFLLGGALAKDYSHQLLLFASYTGICGIAAGCMLSISAIGGLSGLISEAPSRWSSKESAAVSPRLPQYGAIPRA